MQPSAATCVQGITRACNTPGSLGTESLSDFVRDPRAGYDPTIAGAAFGTYNDYIDRCDPSIVTWSNRRDGFIGALQGSHEVNDRCLMTNALLPSSYGAFVSCDPQHACILMSLTEGYCNATRPIGGSCTLDFDCDGGLYCASGTCARRLENGSPCGTSDSPHPNWCRSSFCYMGMCETPTQNHVYCGDYSPRP
jgi:hypothetical protein